jgi:hypothetical protein
MGELDRSAGGGRGEPSLACTAALTVRAWPSLLLAATVGLTVSCGGGSDLVEPVAGTLVVSLTTPHEDDGALLVSLNGPVAPTTISATAGLRLFMSSAPTTSTRLIVTGAISRGTILTLSVPDVRQASEFTGAIEQAASSSLALRSPSDYSVSISR